MNDRAPHLPLFATAGLAAVVLLTSAGCPGGGGGNDAGTDGGPVVPDPAIISPNESGWWRGDVLYEVFVRSFYDSDGDGRGDLVGLTEKLEYLNDGDPQTDTDLGVNGVWLMPIFQSPSYHGYDVTDYRAIESDYGTLDDFDGLVAAAHERGIKVILDLVINHTASTHPWFVSAREGPEAEFRDYYIWRDEPPAATENWRRPWDGAAVWHSANGSYYYGIYQGGMPDLNWRNPAVEAEFVEIMKFWLARGVDGFRVDAVRYLVETELPSRKDNVLTEPVMADHPETHEVIQRLRHAIHQEYPEALFLAEAWTSTRGIAPYYGEGNEFNLAFSFEIAHGILASVKRGARSDVSEANFAAATHFVDRGFEAPFLTNHDQVRAMREFGGSTTTVPWQQARLAVASLMAHPGTPFLYYGEEIGMTGGSRSAQRDEDKRTPMRWDDSPFGGFTTASQSWFGADAVEATGVDVSSQQSDAGSLWHLYRDLIGLRRSTGALHAGATSRPAVTGGTTGPFAILRTASDGGRVLFVANFGGTASGPFTLATTGTATPLIVEGTFNPPVEQDGQLSLDDMPPRAFGFFQLD